jgi:hypothetical protein
MFKKAAQVARRLRSAVFKLAHENPPEVAASEPAPHFSSDYVNLGNPNPRLTLEGPVSDEEFEFLKREVEAGNPIFTEVMGGVRSKIFEWLEECGLPATFYYVLDENQETASLIPVTVEDFKNADPSTRVYCHQILTTSLATGPLPKREHLRDIIIAFLSVDEQVGKSSYTNSEAMNLALEVANLFSCYKRLELSTLEDVTEAVVRGVQSEKRAHTGGRKRGREKQEEAEMWQDLAFTMACKKREEDPFITTRDLALHISNNWTRARSLLPGVESIEKWIRTREQSSNQANRIPRRKKRI